ncbi:MAG: hypothetical protein NAG76_13165 [Candidatus Pristimantibacillus lignocellulolyticus]|uniref:Uncharacterized protein n=1 Tax=Candidatus Pristimantibacillus lignocellulolyticus TaxID=2994561 RepID=A0A9J6Z9S9_9BACL|nr:MAG: hypothetical protein NAG76_13165 [Candidatus Pristimantibacillus lignocellulolyticus]
MRSFTCDHDDYADAAYSASNMPFIASCVARVPITYTPLLASLASCHLLGADKRMMLRSKDEKL